MLAQNFKTPAALGISDAEFEALVKVLGMMDRGEIPDENFSMAKIWAQGDCGTVACIMGHCQLVGGPELFNTLRATDAVVRLFMFGDRRRHSATQEQATQALRNYLVSGDSRWDEVFAN